MLLHIAAVALILVGIAHSYLGERYILIRLFKRNDLPKVLGSEDFTRKTLRFAWHVTTVAWFGIAAILIHLTSDAVNTEVVTGIIGITFLVHFAIALIGSKGKHLSWIAFLLIGAIALYSSYA